MNFFGLHTYPEGNPNAEPLVWIGTAEDFRAGRPGDVLLPVELAEHPALNPGSHNWGYRPSRPAASGWGRPALFERDDYGAEVMYGLMPEPQDGEEPQRAFQPGTAAMLRGAFTLARGLGVRSASGRRRR